MMINQEQANQLAKENMALKNHITQITNQFEAEINDLKKQLKTADKSGEIREKYNQLLERYHLHLVKDL